ncbi:hypothetical protein F5878DRAFT_701675 [Lentinula raphanica]|uniref:Reverse transcriptase domain-containing protein n=1 Tax=Lentinula raphanica TaxID=153919 RepID=A0AA38U5Y3_9AGAR|nr:hypothetical protein F5878DRAFT_701675 [Lentinula raphanica]
MTAPPLPSPPEHLLNNPQILATLHSMSSYIKVETPFNVDCLELLLSTHPNQPFVASVIHSLREGFWPFYEAEWEEKCKQKVENYVTAEVGIAALKAHRDQEVATGRWSEALPEDFVLLPGMKVSPMFVVWQKGKARVVMDQTALGFNDGIPREEAKVKYDDMHTFGQVLNDVIKEHPNEELVLFKSDVAKAFLNLPAHPLWQLCQVVSVEGRFHIVRRLVFGTRTTPCCWCSVSALLCWFGTEKLGIPNLHVYMDDFFGWDFKRNLIIFHGKKYPKRQVQFLVFWDMIDCPYEARKQDWGVWLLIIGFLTDIMKGFISLTQESIDELVKAIHTFLSSPNRKAALRDWQHLTEMYHKMSDKTLQFRHIPINGEVHRDLTWFSDMLKSAIGIQFVDVQVWSDSEADFVCWTDASNIGLSFVYASNGFCY